jgi:hypothetical protein
LAGAHPIWEYGAAKILDVLKNVQEMMMLVKKSGKRLDRIRKGIQK